MIFSKDFVKGELYLTKDTFKLIRLSDRLLIDFTENDWVIFIGLEVLVVRYQWIFLTNKVIDNELRNNSFTWRTFIIRSTAPNLFSKRTIARVLNLVGFNSSKATLISSGLFTTHSKTSSFIRTVRVYLILAGVLGIFCA